MSPTRAGAGGAGRRRASGSSKSSSSSRSASADVGAADGRRRAGRAGSAGTARSASASSAAGSRRAAAGRRGSSQRSTSCAAQVGGGEVDVLEHLVHERAEGGAPRAGRPSARARRAPGWPGRSAVGARPASGPGPGSSTVPGCSVSLSTPDARTSSCSARGEPGVGRARPGVVEDPVEPADLEHPGRLAAGSKRGATPGRRPRSTAMVPPAPAAERLAARTHDVASGPPVTVRGSSPPVDRSRRTAAGAAGEVGGVGRRRPVHHHLASGPGSARRRPAAATPRRPPRGARGRVRRTRRRRTAHVEDPTPAGSCRCSGSGW